MLRKAQKRERRRKGIRARITGTAERPRLVVSRSLQSMFVQLIDDAAGKTLVSVHSKTAGAVAATGEAGERTGKVATSYLLGKLIAAKAAEQKITTIVFDRAGYRYHGRVKAVAEGAREGGLVF